MLDKFPVGEERLAMGQLEPGNPVEITVSYEDKEAVSQLRVTVWGKDNQKFVRDISVADTISIDLAGDELSAAKAIEAKLYTIHAIFKKESEPDRLIMKGRVLLG